MTSIFLTGELIEARRGDTTNFACPCCWGSRPSWDHEHLPYICTISPGINPYTRNRIYVEGVTICKYCMVRKYREKIKITYQLAFKIAGEGNNINWIMTGFKKYLPFIA